MPVQQRYPTYLEDQRAFFDELITEDWSTYFSPEWDYVRRYEVARLFAITRPKRILDVGCGCGFHDREMADYAFVEQVDAIDYSAASIAKANEHYAHPKVRRWVSSLEEAVAERPYDLVVSFQVFEHVSRPQEFLEHCARLCGPGGHVAVVTPNRLRLPNRLARLRGRPASMLDPQHFREYAAREVLEMASRCRLDHVATFGYGLHGLRLVDSLPLSWRTRLGTAAPSIAHCIGVVMQKAAARGGG